MSQKTVNLKQFTTMTDIKIQMNIKWTLTTSAGLKPIPVFPEIFIICQKKILFWVWISFTHFKRHPPFCRTKIKCNINSKWWDGSGWVENKTSLGCTTSFFLLSHYIYFGAICLVFYVLLTECLEPCSNSSTRLSSN